jgi:hypothetical protein
MRRHGNWRGQVHIEAIVCFACFLGILGLAMHALSESGKSAEKAASAIEAKSSAEQCCAAVDSVYSNGAAGLPLAQMQCMVEENSVESRRGEKEKQSDCLAPEFRVAQSGGKSALEVALSEHYG